MAFAQSRFNLRRVTHLMQRDAERVLVYPACPCAQGADPLAPARARGDPSCPLCGGLGWSYGPPVEAWGTVSGYKDILDPTDVAVFEPGDLVLSLPPLCPVTVADGDRIVLPRWDWGFPSPATLVTHSAAGVDRLPFVVARLLRARWTQNGVTTDFTPGVDLVAQGDTLVWQPGRLPAGAVYGVQATVYPEFIARANLFARLDRGTPVGQKVALKRRQIATLPLPNGLPPEWGRQ